VRVQAPYASASTLLMGCTSVKVIQYEIRCSAACTVRPFAMILPLNLDPPNADSDIRMSVE
jgi:hypothetical protein